MMPPEGILCTGRLPLVQSGVAEAAGRAWPQMGEVLLLWGIFLATQELKSRFPNCSWQYFAIFAAQVLFLAGVTAYSVWCAPAPAPACMQSLHAAALLTRRSSSAGLARVVPLLPVCPGCRQ